MMYTGKRKRGGAKKWTSDKQKQRAMGDNLDKKKGWEAKDESGLVYLYTYIHTYMYTNIHTYIYMHVNVCVCVCVYRYVYMCKVIVGLCCIELI